LKQTTYHHWSGYSGKVPRRQDAPHAHCIQFDPTERHIYATDLGADKIWCYDWVSRCGNMYMDTNTAQPWVPATQGTGPRHMSFHPSGSHVYMSGELNNTVYVYNIPQDGFLTGQLAIAQVLSTLPEDYKGSNIAAHVQVSPDARFVYVSNRGHNSIAIFAIQPDKKLALVGHESTRGSTPRHFVISPDGKFMLVGNEDSNTIIPFRIDTALGKLSYMGEDIPCPTPLCLNLVQF